MHSRPPMGLFRPTALDSSLNGRRSGAEIPCPKCNCRFFKFGGETQSCQWGKPADLSKAGAKRCMSPEVAHRAISLLGDDDVALGADCVKTFFLPQKLHATGDDPRRHDGLRIFLLYRVRSQPGRKLGPR